MLSASQMSLRFKRNDIHTTTTTQRGCLRVMPMGKKSRQKVVVGDKGGTILCFGVGKHHDVKTEFTTTPVQDRIVTRIELFQDQVFAAIGERVNAFTKKGRGFFSLETNLSEPIQQLRVNTPYLFTAGEYVVTKFREAEELGFTMAPDKVHDVLLNALDENGSIDVYIGCEDRTIRTIRDGALAAQVNCESPVRAMQFLTNAAKPDKKYIIYGTVGGSVGGYTITPDGLKKAFVAMPPSRLGAVTALSCLDITHDGVSDVLVGRDDGGVEVHSFDLNPDGTPVQVWRGDVQESITALDSGFVTNVEREEMLLSTYSGQILSFAYYEDDKSEVPDALQGSQQPLAADVQQPRARPTNVAANDQTSIMKAKIEETMGEIQQLNEAMQRKKHEFTQMSGVVEEKTRKGQAPAMDRLKATTATFTMSDSFRVNDAASVCLTLQLDAVVDTVSLQSTLQLEMLDGDADVNVMSITKKECAPGSTAALLGVYKNHDATVKRVQLQFRPVEGQYGDINVYVLPQMQPRSALKRAFFVPALSLHQRVAAEEAALDPSSDPTYSMLRIRGNFSAKDAHSWIYRCMFDVPENFHGDEGVLVMKNTFVGSYLHVRYKKAECEFYSQNVSSLAIVKDFIAKEATLRKIQLSIDASAKAESTRHVLGLMHDKIHRQSALARDVKLIEALREIEVQEQDVAFLSDEYREILARGKDTEKEFKQQPKRLQYITDVLTRLLTDRGALTGESISPHRAAQVAPLLVSYDREALMDFFMQGL
jgi:Bardet-Biedl syndrome 7 protein